MSKIEIILLVLLAIGICLTVFSLYTGLAFFLVLIGVIGYGVIAPTSSLLCPVISKIEAKNQVLLTFDDGPNPEITPKVLDILKKYNIKACFFVIGKKAMEEPVLLKRIVEEGHLIANHSFNHDFWINTYGTKSLVQEMNECNKIISSVTNEICSFYRPPMGLKNPLLKKALHQTNMKAITWSLRYKEGSSINGGDILLFHDGYALLNKDNPHYATPKLLVEAIEQIQKKGLVCTTSIL